MSTPDDNDTLRVTDARAENLARLDHEATPGPWRFDRVAYVVASDGMVLDTHLDKEAADAVLRVRGHGAEASGHRPAGSQVANATFAAAARNALPDLLADRARLLRLLDECEPSVRFAAESDPAGHEGCEPSDLCPRCQARATLSRLAKLRGERP